MRVEVRARHRPYFVAAIRKVLLEPLFVLATENVRVDERTSTEAARDERPRPLERPDVVHPVHALAGVPEVPAKIVRGARERVRWICLSPLKDTDPETRLREPIRHHRPAEPGTDDDRIEVRFAHFGPSQRLLVTSTVATTVGPGSHSPLEFIWLAM